VQIQNMSDVSSFSLAVVFEMASVTQNLIRVTDALMVTGKY